jgi:choice-of-anchor B domain-containing protein
LKALYTSIALSFLSFFSFAQLNLTYQGEITYDEALSDIWGYAAPDGTEYGLVGVFDGVSIVDLTDPTNPTELFFIDGVGSTWRDIKTWGEFAYVTNETGNGLAVIDLSDLPNSAESFDWTPSLPGMGTLGSCHNIWIDELGYAYLVGCNMNGGGMLYVDVFSNPGQPEFVAAGPNVYSHDVYVRDNLAYSCEINQGYFTIYDVTDKENSILLGTQETQSGLTHNCWLSDDSNILFTTDEVGGATVGSYDVSDPSNIIELDQFAPLETLGSGVIPHNVHVWDDFLIISYYTDGCILVDGSNPDNLVEVGNFDTFLIDATGFSGAWGAYPYLPSGLVLVSDIGNGMYVLEPNYVHACWLEGNVTDADSGLPVNGASLQLVTTNVADQTDIGGDYATGYAISGTYDVEVSEPTYQTGFGTVELVNGEITEFNIELVPLVPFAIAGVVNDAITGDPVPGAAVNISNSDFSYDLVADATGNFTIAAFYEGDYDVFAGIWGYRTAFNGGGTIDETTGSIVMEIEEGYEDIFSLDLGWSANATADQGQWERGVPIGIQPGGVDFYITPNVDVQSDLGNHCYVTGNDGDLFSGVLIGGQVVLESPEFDLTGFAEPWVYYHTWYLSVNPNNGDPTNDQMNVYMSNGEVEVLVDSLTFNALELFDWTPRAVNVGAHLALSDNMTIRFEASAPGNFSSIVEAGIDFFNVTDGNPNSIAQLELMEAELLAWPNPSAGGFNLTYSVEETGTTLVIVNALGQIVEQQKLLGDSGNTFIGKDLADGVYIAKIVGRQSSSKGIRLIKQ